MPYAQSAFARRLWSIRQRLFPTYEEKVYHLQFRHAALIGLAMMCAFFSLPAYHQTMSFADSLYNTSDDIPVEAGYNRVRRFMHGIIYYNLSVAAFMAIHIVIEPLLFQQTAPVWYEITWMLLFVVGEAVSLGLMASSRPFNLCDRDYPVVPTPDPRGGFVPSNSALSVCSNWGGMTGLLGAIIVCFLLHVTWHVVVSLRHRSIRKNVWTAPITDYRWKLPSPLERIQQVFPGDIEKSAAQNQDEKHIDSQISSTDYTSKGTKSETLSFPGTVSVNEEYSNFSHALNAPKLQALPVTSQPVILQQSIITQSDTSSILESDRGSSPGSPKEPAPFSYTNRV